MSRKLTVAGAQLGPIQRSDARETVVERMVRLLELSHRRGAEVVVFPELALTTFFPRWYYADIEDADVWFETSFPSETTMPLFDAIRKWGLSMHLGFAEMVEEADDGGTVRKRRFNTSVFVAPSGEVVLKYRKIHLPGDADHSRERSVQHLEKRYFECGDLGFPVVRAPVGRLDGVNVGMLICNDRRWPEAWRSLGLQDVELVMLGYNTPSTNKSLVGFQAPHMPAFHSRLVVQAGCYQNSCFAVAVAKAGNEDGHDMLGQSIIVDPNGTVIAEASSWGDELILADCDLDMCELGKRSIFDFHKHRRPEAYARIVEQTGRQPPPRWKGE